MKRNMKRYVNINNKMLSIMGCEPEGSCTGHSSKNNAVG